ncbi:manganese/zinc/iron transport system permease protein [Laceyella sacchari]|uniref:metal ABC transporter permease n=1 Tax=Laceyella sacchari TaxID=37482 RepID=UPI001053F179|nr:metal ABC transporter permease [Laceyella sacchari]TCW41109.1 manganese/zinc/iron transport system permease protein [Laceyella sacchari]
MFEPNALWVVVGTSVLGLTSGIIGSFAFLRKRGLMGDVLSHAALPGICLAFMVTGTKNMFAFLIGALLTGLVASFAINFITARSRIKEDTALGLTLSVFFGLGIVLLTQIQHSPNGNQSGLDKFLFGQAAAIIQSDLLLLGIISLLLITLCALFFKELKLLAFDPAFAESIGFPLRPLEFLFMLLLVTTVVIGLQAAGVILMAALLITPAAAARYWTERLGRMVIIAACFGGLSGLLGSWISTFGAQLSTGPIIVLSSTALFFLSMLCAPQRGLIAKSWRAARLKTKLAEETALTALYNWMERNQQPTIPESELSAILLEAKLSSKQLDNLVRKGWLCRQDGALTFSETGWKEAYNTTLFQRLMEVWAMYETSIDSPVPLQEIGRKEEFPAQLRRTLLALLHRHQHAPQYLPDHLSPSDQGGFL